MRFEVSSAASSLLLKKLNVPNTANIEQFYSGAFRS